jgi:hypothetical protein
MSATEVFEMIKTFNWGFFEYISLLRKIQFYLMGEYIVWYMFLVVILIGLPILHVYYVKPELQRRKRENGKQKALAEYEKRGIK